MSNILTDIFRAFVEPILSVLFWSFYVIWAIIGVLVIVGLFLFFKFASKKTINTTMRILFFAFLQTLLFLSLLFMVERLGIAMLYVTRFNQEVFTTGELAMVFFIIILILDFVVEIIRYFVMKILPVRTLIVRSFIISIIQYLVFYLVLLTLSYFNIIILNLSSSIGLDSNINFFVFFYSFILISELVIEFIRIKVIGEKK